MMKSTFLRFFFGLPGARCPGPQPDQRGGLLGGCPKAAVGGAACDWERRMEPFGQRFMNNIILVISGSKYDIRILVHQHYILVYQNMWDYFLVILL